MRMKWVLFGFGIWYLLFALSFLPSEKFLPEPVEDGWEIVRGVQWGLMTLVSIALLQVLGPVAALFGSGGGLSRMHVEEILLAVILFAAAAYVAVRLLRDDLTPGRRGLNVFFLLLALTTVAMVRFTMYSWGNFSS